MASRRLTILSKQLKEQTEPAPTARLAGRYLSQAVIDILRTNRLAGEVLLRLPRRQEEGLPAALGLTWHRQQLSLFYNAAQLARVVPDQFLALLNHEALHVIWRHPFRYAQRADQANVQVACDIAVNQYLATVPAGTATISALERLLHRKIPAQRDSSYYLQLIEKFRLHLEATTDGRGQLLNRQPDQKRLGIQPRPGRPLAQLESHRGWQTDAARINSLRRLGQLQNLLKAAWQATPKRNRGLLPGNLQQALESATTRPALRWTRQLRLMLGTVARGYQDSWGRFNRRQPMRMDLPGRMTRYVISLDIFVDNSGSMNNQTISELLTTINTIGQQFQLVATVYPFDAVVQEEGIQSLQPGHKVAYQRTGGGGTRFQAIFDYLHQHHIARNGHLVVIMTDGWGEKELITYGYRNVLWLLTTDCEQLSVTEPPGRVVSIREE